jgi:hypothetical protein
MRGVILALMLGSAAATCPAFGNCADCLSPSNGLDCGWCSPDPAVWGNGSMATQCMDHASKGWNCFNLYMHEGCVAGYVCDTSSGQCVLGAAGEGDTLANCEETCSTDPPPDNQYTCDTATFTCVESTNGNEEKTCDAACADETPADLIGLWRGLSVNTGFAQDEWVMNFTQSEVAWGTVGDPRQGVADVAATGPSVLRLTFTAPEAMVGSIYFASYTNPGWPTGPESSGLSIAVQNSDNHQTPPTNVADAMGNDLFDVIVLNRCNEWGDAGCDFSPSFAKAGLAAKATKAIAAKKLARKAAKEGPLLGGDAATWTPKGASADSCIDYGDCDSCLDDASGVCGWCDGVVTDTDGNVVCGDDGNGCCGGNDGFSQCNVAFRKTCPVVCDWTDWENPTCREATTPEYVDPDVQKAATCDDMPWCTADVFQYCDTDASTCKTVYSEADCLAVPDGMCDPANPSCDSTECKVTSYVWCDPVLGCQATSDEAECAANPLCDDKDPSATCDPSICLAQVFYTCDEDTFKCAPHTGPLPKPPTPYFNSTEECEAACVDEDLSGVWRALAINAGYVAGEWDFALGASTIVYKNAASGASFSGTYVIGDSITESTYKAAEIVVTLSTGEVLTGIVSNDRDEDTAIGPVTKFMYLGLPTVTGAVASFDAAMATSYQEFVMIACLDDGIQQGCDFSKASP